MPNCSLSRRAVAPIFQRCSGNFSASARSEGLSLPVVIRLVGCSAPGRVPFYDLCSLGGTDAFRGFNITQVLDNALLSTQIEYRKRLGKRIPDSPSATRSRITPSACRCARRMPTACWSGIRASNGPAADSPPPPPTSRAGAIRSSAVRRWKRRISTGSSVHLRSLVAAMNQKSSVTKTSNLSHRC